MPPGTEAAVALVARVAIVAEPLGLTGYEPSGTNRSEIELMQ